MILVTIDLYYIARLFYAQSVIPPVCEAQMASISEMASAGNNALIKSIRLSATVARIPLATDDAIGRLKAEKQVGSQNTCSA